MVNAIAPQDVYGRLAETAFITPAETLRLICPQLVLSDVQPYLGLSAFTESDAEFFFGREREVVKLLDALRREPRFLAVLGPSGSGKSSVVQSGLIPELRRCGLPGSDRWGIITARPGEKPLRSLEAGGLALAERGLVLATRGWLEKNPERTRLMLIIDQFEELFAAASPPDAAEFLSQLQSLLKADLPLTLMLIMRDDFFSRLGREASPALFEWVQRGFVHISAALEVGEIAEIIRPCTKGRPAVRGGAGGCYRPGRPGRRRAGRAEHGSASAGVRPDPVVDAPPRGLSHPRGLLCHRRCHREPHSVGRSGLSELGPGGPGRSSPPRAGRAGEPGGRAAGGA